MKKTFKKAGVAVLSMAMLLSMGAMAMPAGAQELPNGSKLTINGTYGNYCVYKVATSTKTAGTVSYTIDDDFASVLEIKSGYVTQKGVEGKVKDFDKDKMVALANALQAAAPAKADKVVQISTKEKGSVDLDLMDAALGSGYYLILGTTSGRTQPILIDIVPGDTADEVVTKSVTAKHSDVPFTKAITKIDNPHSDNNLIGKDSAGNNGGTGIAEIGGIVTYTLSTEFPNYDGSVTAIDDFTITDIPEESLTINSANIQVLVDGAVVEAGDTTYELKKDIKASDLTTAYKENNGNDFVTTVREDGTGFQVVFKDDYVLRNGGKEVAVVFNATVNDNADLVKDVDTADDSNDNGATLSYSNNFFTGKGQVKYPDKPETPPSPTPDDNPPSKPEEDEDNPKVIPDDAFVYCTLVTVNKVDPSNTALPGAKFSLYDSQGSLVATVGNGTTDTKFDFKGLGAGTYTLKETKVPDGYAEAPDVTFTVKADKVNDMFAAASFTFENTTSDNTITVIDNPLQTLPGTGGIGTYLFTIGGAAIVLLAGVLFVFYIRKRKTEE